MNKGPMSGTIEVDAGQEVDGLDNFPASVGGDGGEHHGAREELQQNWAPPIEFGHASDKDVDQVEALGEDLAATTRRKASGGEQCCKGGSAGGVILLRVLGP